MANWISSKLKVAETFLQQIDQQAAESLGKSEGARPDSVQEQQSPAKTGSVSLKDQLKIRAPEKNVTNSNSSSLRRGPKSATSSSSSPANPDATVAADTDWTELLSSPNSISSSNRPNGNARKGRSRDGYGSSSSATNRRSAGSAPKPVRKSDVSSESKAFSLAKFNNGGPRIDEKAGFSGRSERSISVQTKRGDENKALGSGDGMSQEVKEDIFAKVMVDPRTPLSEEVMDGGGKSVAGVGIKINTLNAQAEGRRVRGEVRGNNERNYGKGSSFESDGGVDSESSSSSTSDSEDEAEKKRRAEQILAEESAARALEAIKERENVIARLEGEKQSLEKILEERERQQAQEASELQTSMKETMEAVELEKQKLDSTRMEALSRTSKLETINAELAKSLVTTQWDLEMEVNRVAELRRQIEYKEIAVEGLRRRMEKSNQDLSSLGQSDVSNEAKFEREMLEEEYSFTCDKIAQLQAKANMLEKDIETMQKDIENPTQVEIQLKKRLAQLTDHLIQKQAQVEALASEKATLLFRIETAARLLDEEKAAMQLTDVKDIEAGTWAPLNPKLKPMFKEKIRSGGKQLWSFIRQLDAIFSAGYLYMRRNPKAQIWSLVYLVCLHVWVLYIFISHSQASDKAGSGAVISLENINKTTGP